MDNNKKNIDQFFLEQLADAREAPPASVWEGLEERLNANPPKHWMSGKGFIASLAALIVTIGGIAYFWSGSSATVQETKQEMVAGNEAGLTGQEAAVNSTTISTDNNNTKQKVDAERATTQQEAHSGGTASLEGSATIGGPDHDHAVAPSTMSKAASGRGVKYTTTAKHSGAAAHHKPLKEKSLAQTASGLGANSTTTSRRSVATTHHKPLKEKSLAKTANDQQTTAQPTRGEQPVLKSSDRMVATNKAAKGGNAADVPKFNKERNISGNTEPDRKPEAQNIADNQQEAVVMHKAEFKGVAGTADEEQRPEQELAIKDAGATSEPAAAPELKTPKATATAAAKAEAKVVRGKIARLSQNNTHAITLKMKPEQRMPIAEEQRIRRSLELFLGIKGGYETGFNSFTSGKYVGSVFGEVQVTDRWSFLLQPSIKIAKLNRTTFMPGNYYQAGATTSTMFNVTGDDSAGFRYDYAYRQTYDSMITSMEMKKNFTEFELPLFVRYKFTPQFSAMAGVNVTFGKIPLWTNKLQTLSGLVIVDTLRNSVDSVAPAPSEKFAHNGSTPYTNYNPTALPANTSPVRFGYSLGLTYTFREKLMLDLMMQQNLSGYKGITQPDVQQIFSQMYFRLSVGYKLFGTGKK